MNAKTFSVFSLLVAAGLAIAGCDSQDSSSDVIVIATAGSS